MSNLRSSRQVTTLTIRNDMNPLHDLLCGVNGLLPDGLLFRSH